MSGLIIVHKPYQVGDHLFLNLNSETAGTHTNLLWQTCRRQILFSDESLFQAGSVDEECEIYCDLEAEEFLIQVLCGLKSPLVGETEVFGQFKNWWAQMPACDFKNKFEGRIQNLFSAVKKIREESLCGLGSQSYGSLLRKKIDEHFEKNMAQSICIDFIGAGQLVEEIVPWVQKKWAYRIRCRQPDKVRSEKRLGEPLETLHLQDSTRVSQCLVIAAPLPHEELNLWIKQRAPAADQAQMPLIFDFRHDSLKFQSSLVIQNYYDLNALTAEVEEHKQSIQNQVLQAHQSIQSWKQAEMKRAQVRPFGWDDL